MTLTVTSVDGGIVIESMKQLYVTLNGLASKVLPNPKRASSGISTGNVFVNSLYSSPFEMDEQEDYQYAMVCSGFMTSVKLASLGEIRPKELVPAPLFKSELFHMQLVHLAWRIDSLLSSPSSDEIYMANMETIVGEVLHDIPADCQQRLVFERNVKKLVDRMTQSRAAAATGELFYFIPPGGKTMPMPSLYQMSSIVTSYKYEHHLRQLGIDLKRVSFDTVFAWLSRMVKNRRFHYKRLKELVMKDLVTQPDSTTELQGFLANNIVTLEKNLRVAAFILEQLMAAPWNVTAASLTAKKYSTQKEKYQNDVKEYKNMKEEIDAIPPPVVVVPGPDDDVELSELSFWDDELDAVLDKVREEAKIALTKMETGYLQVTSGKHILHSEFRAASPPGLHPIRPTIPQVVDKKLLRTIQTQVEENGEERIKVIFEKCI